MGLMPRTLDRARTRPRASYGLVFCKVSKLIGNLVLVGTVAGVLVRAPRGMPCDTGVTSTHTTTPRFPEGRRGVASPRGTSSR